MCWYELFLLSINAKCTYNPNLDEGKTKSERWGKTYQADQRGCEVEWWMEKILNSTREDKKQQVSHFSWLFSTLCRSLCICLYNEPRLAPLIPYCPSACVSKKIMLGQKHSFTHIQTLVLSHSFSWGSLSPGALGFIKERKACEWIGFPSEGWWTATAAPRPASLSLALFSLPPPLLLNTFRLIVCCCWLKLSQLPSAAAAPRKEQLECVNAA